jgi:hypothetical protein
MNLASSTLHGILRAAAQMFVKYDDEFLSQQPAPEKWSPIQILGHLTDSAYNNHRRFLMAADQDHLRFSGYNQEAWVIRNGYQERETGEVIETFRMAQHHLAEMIDRLPEELLSRKTREHELDKMAMRHVAPGSESCLGYMVEDYLFHLVHHLKQIDPTFSAEWYIGYDKSPGKY